VVVVVEDESPSDVGRLLRDLEEHAPDGTQVVVVANGTERELAGLLGAVDPGAPGVVTEVIRLAQRQGRAAALNAGIRRAMAPVVVWLDADVEITGDAITPLALALHDPRVAVTGAVGLVSDDPSRFEPAPPDADDAAAVDGRLLAFRRADYVERGPLDEAFAHPSSLDEWWSLVLRDGWFAIEIPEDGVADGTADEHRPEGEDVDGLGAAALMDPEAVRPRRAVQLANLPVTLSGAPWSERPAPDVERQRRRNRYRLLKRFASRRDLVG
jgi:glycosyltransferase involved in cell wall biosynthesis